MNSCKPVTIYSIIGIILLISLSSSFAAYIQKQKEKSDLIDAINVAVMVSGLIVIIISFIVSMPVLAIICNNTENSTAIVTFVIIVPLILSSICCSSGYLFI